MRRLGRSSCALILPFALATAILLEGCSGAEGPRAASPWATVDAARAGTVSWVPAADARAQAAALPGGATVERAGDRIVVLGRAVRLTVLAADHAGLGDWFEIAGLPNPTIAVPLGATVTIRFVNTDVAAAHGWRLTAAQPPFGFFVTSSAPPAPDTISPVLPAATATHVAATTITFVARAPGRYSYLCTMPGQALYGMLGTLVVFAGEGETALRVDLASK